MLALAQAAPDSVKDDSAAGSLKQLKDAMARFEAIKERRSSSAYDRTCSALEALAKTDKAGLSRLLRSFDEPRAQA